VGKKAVAVLTPHHIPAPSTVFRKIRIDDADGQARYRLRSAYDGKSAA
jgi:hypothetical protein